MDGDDILTRLFDKLFDYEKPTSVVTQLKPYAFFYRWVGIFPIQFSNGLARNSFFFFFWPFALFGTIYSGIVDDLAVFKIETKRRILFPVITTVVCMITSKNFAPLIANIQRYDEEFSTNLWITKRHRRLKGGRFVWMLWIPINVWVQIMIDCGSRNLNWKEHLLEPKVLARSIGESLPFTILTVYLLYCNELKLRFLDLNKSFVSFLESSYKYSPEDFLQRSFEKYRLMHFRLTDECVRMANAAFGAPLICCYLWTAVSSISIIYWCASGQTSNILSTELIMIVNCGYMYMVPVLSDGLTKASSGLVTDLFMLPIAELKMKTKLQITIFVYEVTLNKSVMSACGYFDLRKSFISTWFGLIVSCLIIVLQRTKIALSAAAAAAAALSSTSTQTSTPTPSPS